MDPCLPERAGSRPPNPFLFLAKWYDLLRSLPRRRKTASGDADRKSSLLPDTDRSGDGFRGTSGCGDVQDEVLLTINDFDHREACRTIPLTPKEQSVAFRPIRWPTLTPECKAWCDENIPGYVVRNNKAANCLIDIAFKSERDRVLFRMFWL